MTRGFVFVDEVVSGVRWDAKYATWDNFTGKPVDGYVANRIVGTTALCAALDQAREAAAALGFGLLLWDGYRPQRAVERFLRWAKEPEDGRTKPRYYPNINRAEMFERGYVAAKSGHSRGSTVDLTLYHLATGERAQMDGDHDLMDPISHHEAGGITRVAARNRRSLRSIMESSGFRSYDCEWWHYTLSGEPYPDTYFDFPIATTSNDNGGGGGARALLDI
jgi:D-alanyl-D-alanine dipeptidase